MFDDLYKYLEKLQDHDWTYEWSDCHTTWKRGRDNHKLLIAEAHVNPEKMRLYLAFSTCCTYNLSDTLNDIEVLRETINSVVP